MKDADFGVFEWRFTVFGWFASDIKLGEFLNEELRFGAIQTPNAANLIDWT